MKICVVGPSKRFFSGVTNQTVYLANALSKRNEVSVILLRNLLPRRLFPGREHVGKEQYVADFLPHIAVYDGMDYNSLVSWLGAYRFLKKNKPDAIVMLWWTSSVAHMQIALRLMNRCSVKARNVLEMHEVVDPLEERILPLRLYSRLAGRRLVRGSDICTAKSDFNRAQIAEIYGISPDKTAVVPHGLYENYERSIDKDQAKKELGIKEEFVILYFGLIRHYKGVLDLIKAFDRLPQDVAQRSRLLIVGEVWEEHDVLRNQIEISPYREQITLEARYVADSLIPVYFSSADAVALPYLRSAGSGVAHLAMTYGKPVIVSDVPALMETLGGYPGSIFVKPGNSDAICESIETIYQAFVSGKELRYTCNHDSWDDIARRYESIIGNLLSKGKTK